MTGFNSFYSFSLRSSSISVGERCWFAHFKLDGDFSHLFPLIQATATEAVHYESPEFIQFRLDQIVCTLYPPDVVVSRLFYGREQALEFAQRLIDYLNELELHKSEIKPKFKKLSRLHVPEILHFLPMSNCGECGYPTCMAFAVAVSRRKARLMMCAQFPEPADAKIIFVVSDQTSEAIKSIEVDSDLAGVQISKMEDAQSEAQAQLPRKGRPGRSARIMGNRDGIIFKISGREAEVLRLITEGFTNREIAQILKVSHNTVKSHVAHIFNKLGVNDRTQAAVWAAQNELV